MTDSEELWYKLVEIKSEVDEIRKELLHLDMENHPDPIDVSKSDISDHLDEVAETLAEYAEGFRDES